VHHVERARTQTAHKYVHYEILIAPSDIKRRVAITKLTSALKNEFSGARSGFDSKHHMHVARIGDNLAGVRDLAFYNPRAVFVSPRARAR
jgi:hypothetical protein